MSTLAGRRLLDLEMAARLVLATGGQTDYGEDDFAADIAVIEAEARQQAIDAYLAQKEGAPERWYCDACGCSVLSKNRENHLLGLSHQRKAGAP